jgi:hypothetical protein
MLILKHQLAQHLAQTDLKTYFFTRDPSSSITPLISFCLRSCIATNLASTVLLTHRRDMYVSLFWPMRKTRQKACCSDAEFHQGSIMMTREAMVRLRPTGACVSKKVS